MPDKDVLRKQYELVLLEYRFQVQLNWDRAKHYLVFNTALFGAAAALYKDAKTGPAQAAVGALLFVAAANSFLGQIGVKKGHEFYREVRNLKSRLEKDLDLVDYAIATTPGMKRDHDQDPAGTPGRFLFGLDKIANQIRTLLVAIAIFAAFGSIYAATTAYSTWTKPPPPPVPAAPPHNP